MSKVYCDECGWVGDKDEILIIENPFDEDKIIIGCPKCKWVNGSFSPMTKEDENE